MNYMSDVTRHMDYSQDPLKNYYKMTNFRHFIFYFFFKFNYLIKVLHIKIK